MRLLLTVVVFLASLVAAVFVHAAKADAAWDRPQQIDSGSAPRLRLTAERTVIGYIQRSTADARRLLSGEGNEPLTRVRVPKPGHVVAFDVDATGKIVALRPHRRRLLAYEGTRWRALTRSLTNALDARLAVADSGAAVAAWLQREGSRAVVHAAVRRPGARRFGRAQRLSGLVSRSDQTLEVAVDDAGEAVVAFTEAGDLTMARTVAGSFATPVRVHDRTEVVAGAFRAVAAIRGQIAVVAFTRLEDREPPAYRLSVATQTGDTAPIVETVAQDVSAFDIAAAVEPDGPAVLSTPIGPPYSLRLHRRAAAWAEAAAIPATAAPSTIAYSGGAVTWTEADRGFAWFDGQTLGLGQAIAPVAAVSGGRAMVVWDRGPGRSMRLATFTP